MKHNAQVCAAKGCIFIFISQDRCGSVAAETDPVEKKMKNLSIPSGPVQENLLEEVFVMLIPFLSGGYFNLSSNLSSNSPPELMYIYVVFKGWVHINYGISVNFHSVFAL